LVFEERKSGIQRSPQT